MSSATSVRDELWRELQGQLSGDRVKVYDSFMAWGPATTRRIAELVQIDILTVRPRATELLQLGLLELVGRDGHEGRYQAVRAEDVASRAEESERPQQMMMF